MGFDVMKVFLAATTAYTVTSVANRFLFFFLAFLPYKVTALLIDISFRYFFAYCTLDCHVLLLWYSFMLMYLIIWRRNEYNPVYLLNPSVVHGRL